MILLYSSTDYCKGLGITPTPIPVPPANDEFKMGGLFVFYYSSSNPQKGIQRGEAYHLGYAYKDVQLEVNRIFNEIPSNIRNQVSIHQ